MTRSVVIRHTPHMPWPLSVVGRYVVTAAVLAAALHSVTGGDLAGTLARALNGTLGDVARVVTGSLVDVAAVSTVPGWVGIVAVACAATAGLLVLWRRIARPRRRPHDLLAVADAERPYRRDLHAELVVDRRGFLFVRRVLFTASGLPWRQLHHLPRDYAERFVRPVAVHTEGGRTWWIVGNEFYWVNSTYSLETVEAVVEALRWRRRPRLDVDVPSDEKERRETFLSTCRPSLGRHNGLVCVRCRETIDARDRAAVSRLWTEVGLRAADVQLLCGACSGRSLPAASTS